jgi:hypothetical protein
MKCSNCGTDNLKRAKFCEKCGQSLAPGNICPKCGHKNKPTAVHCIECGTNLTQPATAKLIQETPEIKKDDSAKPKRAISPLVWVLGGVLGVVILVLAGILMGLIKIPSPPKPETSILPEFVVSAWKGAYDLQATNPAITSTASTGQVIQESQSKYVRALFNCDEKGKSPVYATTTDKIQDYIGWTAATQTQSADFLRYMHFTVTVNDNPANYQGPFSNEIILDQQKSIYYSSPLVTLPALAAGTHHIRTEITWMQKIYDGEGYYGPGTSNAKLVGNCTVIVAPADTADGQKAVNDNVNRVVVKACTPFVNKPDCDARNGNWTVNPFTNEEFCTCDANNPKQECINNNGAWFEKKQHCTYQKENWAICAPFQTKDICESMDQTWQVNEKTGEEYCVCDDQNPRQECENYDGKWDDVIQKCSFKGGDVGDDQIKTGCPDILNYTGGNILGNTREAWLKSCVGRGGYMDYDKNWNNICICPDAGSAQPTCNWINAGTDGKQISHSIDCSTYKDNCSVKIKYGDAFEIKDFSYKVVIKLKNGKTISSTRPGAPSSSLCNTWKKGELSCELLNNESKYGYPEMKGAEDVQDIYLCSTRCCVDLKKLESGSVPLLGLASNCPLNGDLSASIKEWKSNGNITMQIKNNSDWTVGSFETNLKDAKGADWTTLTCKRNTNDSKIMVCTGAAVGKTGAGSMSFTFNSDSGTCSIQDLTFPIPCARPCSGTCCPQGYTCCGCGCQFLGSSGSCSSACS